MFDHVDDVLIVCNSEQRQLLIVLDPLFVTPLFITFTIVTLKTKIPSLLYIRFDV